MSPGGHLVTTAVAAGVGLAATGSVPFAAGIVVGGFFIDVDHAVDYVIVERRRELTPAAFLRYYTEGRARRAVLALHSYELFLALAVLAWWLDSAWLAGYLAGGVYSFGFRLAHGFDAETLFGSEPRIVPVGFWRSFFSGASPRAGGRPAPRG